MSEKFEMSIQCGKFWVKREDLPEEKPLRNVMIIILSCQPNDCRDKKAYLSLVEYFAKDIIEKLK